MIRAFFIKVAFIMCLQAAVAQSFSPPHDPIGSGIYLRGGLAHLVIKDQYISDEKYSGSATSFGLSWFRADSSSGYRVGMDFVDAHAVRNDNVSAQVLQGALTLDFLTNVGKLRLLDHDLFALLGPSADIFLYYRQQNIASGGNALFSAYSMALFISASVNGTLVLPLSSSMACEGSARLAILSLGARLIDLSEKDASFVKAVTAFSGLRGSTELLVRYQISNRFLVKAGYRFEICQSTSWNYLISANDQFEILGSVQL